MNCDRQALSAYLDGELPAQERADVKAHLQSCLACQREIKALSAIDQDLWALAAPELDPSAVERAVRAARQAVSHLPAADGRAANPGDASAGAPAPGRPSTLGWLGWLVTGRVSIPVPALALGLAAVLFMLGRWGSAGGAILASRSSERTGHRPRPLLVTDSGPGPGPEPLEREGAGAGRTWTFCEEWSDPRALWGDAARGGPTGGGDGGDASGPAAQAAWPEDVQRPEASSGAPAGSGQEGRQGFAVIYEEHHRI